MMEINRNNYEAYFIDYLEGNLDERLVDSFIEFIKLNPDLKEELDLFESVSAAPEDISFNKKEKLYKEKYDSEKEFDNAAVAKLEGDISDEEKFEFEIYLAEHPEKKKEATLFKQTKLVADSSVVFDKKDKLYRKSGRKVFLLWSGRVAAILILAFAVFTLLDKTSNEIPIENQVAKVEKKKVEREKMTGPKVKSEPVQQKKDDLPKKKKVSPKPIVKKATPEKKTSKSIRETSKGRLEVEDVAVIRVVIDVPAELKGITASINIKRPKATMATMYISYPDEYYGDEWLLADQVKQKFSLGKIRKAGLNLFTSISNERFTYETNDDGKVTEYKYDSRLLAFSLPGKRVQPE